MKVRLKKDWRNQKAGHVFEDIPAGQAQVMVERGFAEYLDEHVQRAPVDRMVRARKAERRAS